MKMLLCVRLFTILLIISILHLNGCTLIGLGIGSAVDSKNRTSWQVPGWQLETVSPGSRVNLTLKSGEVVGGKILQVTSLPVTESDGQPGDSLSRAGIILLRSKNANREISFSDVSSVEVITSTNKGKIIGAIVGLTIDGFLVLMVVALGSMDWGGFFGFGSQ